MSLSLLQVNTLPLPPPLGLLDDFSRTTPFLLMLHHLLLDHLPVSWQPMLLHHLPVTWLALLLLHPTVTWLALLLRHLTVTWQARMLLGIVSWRGANFDKPNPYTTTSECLEGGVFRSFVLTVMLSSTQVEPCNAHL